MGGHSRGSRSTGSGQPRVERAPGRARRMRVPVCPGFAPGEFPRGDHSRAGSIPGLNHQAWRTGGSAEPGSGCRRWSPGSGLKNDDTPRACRRCGWQRRNDLGDLKPRLGALARGWPKVPVGKLGKRGKGRGEVTDVGPPVLERFRAIAIGKDGIAVTTRPIAPMNTCRR